MRIRTLLVDDEPPAIERLRQLCAWFEDLRVVGSAGSASAAVAQVRETAPDLVMLDVQLGDATGFDVLAALDARDLPHVVFVTAYDRHAVAAFRQNAVDYLLKPCSAERFGEAVGRVRERMRAAEAPATREQLLAAFREFLAQESSGLRAERRDGLFVEQEGRFVFVDAASIDYVEAARNYVVIHCGRTSHCHRTTISALESLLDPASFVRIHKSVIVNLARVQAIESDFHGAYVFRLASGASCRSGPSYRARVLELLRPRAHGT